MSGHSKWASIKRSKAANDAKRGKIFTKISHEIAIAAREGGADTDANFRLRLILDKARAANMPKDNIERAILRGTGQLEGSDAIEECVYEGYGPQGLAIMLQAVTDNKKRTVAEIRHVFSRFGGNLGADGCVAWMFDHKGYMVVSPGDEDPEEIALMAIDAGAEDFEIGDDGIEIYTEVSDFKAVQESLESDYEVVDASLSWIPKTKMSLDDSQSVKSMKLLEALEELDDVQMVYSNLDITDAVLARYEAEVA